MGRIREPLHFRHGSPRRTRPGPRHRGRTAALTEAGGAILLLFGFAVRWISIPLIVTMLVAILTVHLPHGWFAIAPAQGATSAAQFFSWLGISSAEQSLQQSNEVAQRLSAIRQLLAEHGNPDWLFAHGPVAILNNGAEFAAIYAMMLWQLLSRGAGRYLSLDYWISKRSSH